MVAQTGSNKYHWGVNNKLINLKMYRHTGMLVAGIHRLDSVALRRGFRLQACQNDEIITFIFIYTPMAFRFAQACSFAEKIVFYKPSS